MSIASRLKDVRKGAGLSEKELARLSGVHEKTISSYESGRRIGRMKIEHLVKMLAVIGMSLPVFFMSVDEERETVAMNAEDGPAFRFFDRFMALPEDTQRALLPAFHLLTDIVESRDARRAVADPLTAVKSLARVG
jgi:transcriptional regulator with XRE-family HTH domain